MTPKIRVLVAALAVSLIVAAVALAASSPSVITGNATKITDNSAVLQGTVNPNGSATTYFFQWGLTTSYGVTGKSHNAGSGIKAKTVSATAGGLIPGTTYHFRLVATNRFGTSAGRDRTFTTAGHPPPNATTGPASALSSSSATVTGVISPNGQQTSWTFQFGLTTSYGMQASGGSVPAGSSPVNVAAELQGLAPETVFHYRLVASHSDSPTSFGADQTFMTYPTRRPVPRVRAVTLPHRTHRRPFTLTTSGSVRRPARIPANFACSGNVEIQFFRGAKRVASTFVGVTPGCGFTAKTVLRRLSRRKHRRGPVSLRVEVRFLGNHYLAPHRARREFVTLD